MELPVTWRMPRAVFILLTLTAMPAIASIGRTPGMASVTADGEASYSIPIALPPGTHGMTPALSLEYRHRTQGGLLGVGWSINGLSQVSRCPRTLEQDGVLSPVTMTTADRFCLDGQRLVVTNGVAYGSAAAEYRTEIESFSRIRSYAGTSVGPQYFVVEAPDGRIFEYGATADSRIDGSSTVAIVWALNRIRDRSGNHIDFAYNESPGAAFRIASIRYNSNPSAGIASSHEIAFVYENRPNNEVDVSYIAGTAIRQVLRLERIEVRHDGATQRRYELSYEPALSGSGRSRLSSIQECAKDGTECLSPTAFTWQNAAAGAGPVAAFASTMPSPIAEADRQWHLLDVNGDGRKDIAWAGGSALSTSTIRYRLGLAGGGFGPEINSAIPCPYGIGVPFDHDGDARDDLLMVSAAGVWTVVPGSSSGLGTPAATGIAAPQLLDFRGADINGDGLGDVVWSEILGSSDPNLAVRARLALPGGGFNASFTTLYDQYATMGYDRPEGGQFIGTAGRRIDLDGDGAEDLLMNENYSIARISAATHATDYFDSSFVGAVLFDFNGDGCSDFAYKHHSGTLRVRVAGCGVPWSGPELLGPSMQLYQPWLQAQDWNNDGREDLLMKGSTTWHVAISNGDSFRPIEDTGIPHDGVQWTRTLDIDGDGLRDLAWQAGGQFRHRVRNGPKADLLLSATDGFGVQAAFSYGSLTDDTIYTRGSGAVYPVQDHRPAAIVVSQIATTDGSGTGSNSATRFTYEGLKNHLRGRGSLGFSRRMSFDLTPGQRNRAEETYRQDFPYTRLPSAVIVRQESGALISSASYNWTALSLGSGPALRRFPRLATSTLRRYHVGGALNGTEMSSVVRTVTTIDATSGLASDETTTITEVSGGAHAGATATIRNLRSSIHNDTTNWCLGRPQALQQTASHSLSGGAAITRNASQTWDGVKCRPTQQRLESGNAQMQVIYSLAYDAFGNLASRGVTGIGMSPRTTSVSWGSRGQLPSTIANPLSQASTITWDPASGLPLEITDPNALKVTWTYDAFGNPLQQIQPDGTRTTWSRASCASGCDPRARYRITQEDRDNAGVSKVTTRIDVDQHERAVRVAMQQPGGGYAVALVDADTRGRVLREYLPHWDGGMPEGYWQYTYDSVGRMTDAALYSGGGAADRTIRLQHEGLAVAKTDPLGHTTTGTRTAWGTLAQVVDAAGNSTRYEYDPFGNLLQVRDAGNSVVDAIVYNARGMKVSQQSQDMGAWTWTRNALGEATSIRDAKMQVFAYAYDRLGRPTSRTAPDGTTNWNWGNSGPSRNIGRLASRTSPGYSETFSYDSAGRPSARSIVTDATYRYDYSYDALGLLDVMTYPATGSGGRFAIRHEYDAGRLVHMRDAAAPYGSIWRLNTRDASGNAVDEMLGAAIRVVTGFHPLSGALDYQQVTANGNQIQDLSYSWDAGDNLLRRQDSIRGLTEEFRYDTLDRLDESRRNGVVNLGLDYDVTGNIRWKSDVCTGTSPCYSYHATRKHAVTSAGGQTYAYDANGNMTTRSGAAIAWDSSNLPISIAQPNGNRSQFWYGAAGNRWKQVAIHAGVTETTFYGGELTEKVTRGGTTTWRQYVTTPGGAIAMRLQGGSGSPSLRYLAVDHLGSMNRILDAAGNPLVSGSFTPFGKRRGANWTGTPSATELATIAGITRDGFTGHEHLDNLGLVHMNGRVYDPQIGRFISADPFVTAPYDGQSLNRYAYVGNNPLAFIDPSGFDPATPCMVTPQGACARVTVIGLRWGTSFFMVGGSGSAQVDSAMQRDPCGQESDAYTCATQGFRAVPPATVVLTIGTKADPTLSHSPAMDYVLGAAARVGNITMSASPLTWLFGADADYEWFDVPASAAGQSGATFGEIGNLVGGFAGIIRKGGGYVLKQGSSAYARSLQGFGDYPGVDDFRDIVLKKGTFIIGGYPGQSPFYTTVSTLRRAGYSAREFFGRLQAKVSKNHGPRTRVAVYEVIEDTQAAFGLALQNIKHGLGGFPQIVVEGYESKLRFITDFALGP